eukprot:2735111-Alexandrium_andersonii.AAC.1
MVAPCRWPSPPPHQEWSAGPWCASRCVRAGMRRHPRSLHQGYLAVSRCCAWPHTAHGPAGQHDPLEAPPNGAFWL